jgi:hypothetical protein
MKYTWEEKDIICGRIVCKDPSYQNRTTFEPTGNALKWTQKIGYVFLGGDKGQHFCMVSMTDGMTSVYLKTEKQMADYLNRAELIPMPHSWFMEAMDSLRDCYGKQ